MRPHSFDMGVIVNLYLRLPAQSSWVTFRQTISSSMFLGRGIHVSWLGLLLYIPCEGSIVNGLGLFWLEHSWRDWFVPCLELSLLTGELKVTQREALRAQTWRYQCGIWIGKNCLFHSSFFCWYQVRVSTYSFLVIEGYYVLCDMTESTMFTLVNLQPSMHYYSRRCLPPHTMLYLLCLSLLSPVWS